LRHIFYSNTSPNADLLRIQTNTGVIKTHRKLNTEGRKIVDFIICAINNNPWNSPRAGVILIKNKKILLIERRKYGQKYYTIPGGTLDGDKDMLTLAKREILEETGLNFQPFSLEPIHLVSNGREEYYFISTNIEGQAKLGGPEKDRNHPDNSYKLKWVKLADIKKINLLPKSIRKNIYDFKNTVGTDPKDY
jgi:ADP-ribose pyrophosphatase YjhB (NUDIX family)